MNKSAWFPFYIKPVHPGHYECRYADGLESEFLWEWDGEQWIYWRPSERYPKVPCADQNRDWRGIVEMT